ncbi:MAG: malto-oligosyltrehalose synthase, partial [Bryobacteraceae bacterium]
QFHPGFRFADARDLVPYLNDLGVTDLYSSPRFKARRGSSHGYDVVNPLRINSELGTEQDFDELADKLRHYQMGLLLDVVPNHMAAVAENPWWHDVLENGPASRFACFFDIDWHPTMNKALFLQDNRVLLPILGDLYGNVLSNGELALKIEDTGLYVRYYEHKLPLDPKSTAPILEHAQSLGGSHPDVADILSGLKGLPPFTAADGAEVERRRQEMPVLQERLWSVYRDNPEVKQAIDETIRLFNGTKENPASFDFLDQILSGQPYRIAYWKVGYEEINYRRFFDINTLVALRVELPEVFESRHGELRKLLHAGKVTGVRIDHVDGMYDPLGYLRRMQDLAGRQLYMVVEKVLGRNEQLPQDWPVAGTTGYEFMDAVNEIQIDPQGLEHLEETYARVTGSKRPFAELCYASNKKVMRQLFPGEINRFANELARLAARHREARDIPLSEVLNAFVEVTACLPIYRTYIRDFDIDARDRAYIERTLKKARSRTAEERVSTAAFNFLEQVLLLDPPYYARDQRQEYLQFVMRWQQFTGPVMGKGLEDTSFYAHNSLISRNEVGSDPLRELPPAGLEGFHRFNQDRQRNWPQGLNATSTHDSKRSEDARARINVISEIASEWDVSLTDWMHRNEQFKSPVQAIAAPCPSEEVMIYQSLLGVWPGDDSAIPDLVERMKGFMVKALREAKVHSGWVQPREDYESAVQSFVEKVLQSESFLQSFRPFQKKIAFYGALNALAQLLIKIASPGVPDFYQGTEFWMFSLVDPDNRRSVDYPARIALLESLRKREAEDRRALVNDVIEHWPNHGIKMYLTYKALEFRRKHRDLFREGEYLPLEAGGAGTRHVCAFARRLDSEWAVVVTPVLPAGLGYSPPDLRSARWDNTFVRFPNGAPSRWRNVFTGREQEWSPETSVSELLHDFPVALLATA